MRVLLVVRHPVGGIRTFLRYVLRRFDAPSFEFVLLAPDLAETRVLLDELRGLHVDYRALDPRVGPVALTRAVASILLTRGIDVVHSHGFTSAVCAAPAARMRRIPHVVTCHDVFTQRQLSGLRGCARRFVLERTLSAAARVHCVSRDACDDLMRHLPALQRLEPAPVVIANGIEPGGFLGAEPRDLRGELGLARECFLVGFFGRFMRQKGFADLVDALALLEADASLPSRPMVLAFGEAEAFIREEQARVARLGLSGRVLFLPFVADIASTLKGLDVVAMPSLWEACGLLAIETLVAGVPLVGTDCVGLREILNDTPAARVPAGNAAALSAALRRECCSPTKSAARAFSSTAAQRFDVRGQAAALESLLHEVA